MTNKIAIGLGLTIILAIAVDFALNSGDVSLFLARATFDFTEWLAFWR